MYSQFCQYFKYSTDSPSGLVNLKNKKVGYIKYDKGCQYWRTMKNGKSLFVHRLIWTIIKGDIPKNMVINHIDNNGLNNRIENLELCTISENNRRTKMHTGNGLRKDNILQITGVSVLKVGKYTYTVSKVRYNKFLYTKQFSHLYYSLEESIELAIQWRAKKIKELNEMGAGFTDNS